MPLNPGQVLQERYRIDALLGQGGMGAVYRGTDLRFDAPVAIKENRMVAPGSQAQFGREAGLLYRLRHPHLPRVIDHFSLAGQGQYLVMDYIPGEDLKQVLARRGMLSPGQALALMDQVLDALGYLHNLGIIHRDVKPANVKITPEGTVFLVDFGLAKVHDAAQETTIGARGVTPGYAPAEQYGMGRTDARTDVYSAGATLYALLTGQPPPDAVACVTGQARLVPPRELEAQISPYVERAVMRAMQPRPDDRFQAVADLRAALRGKEPVQESVRPAVEARERPAAHGTRRAGSQRGRWLVAVLGLLSVVTLIALGLAVWQLLSPRADPPRASTPVQESPVAAGVSTQTITLVTATQTAETRVDPSPVAIPSATPEPTPTRLMQLDGMPGNWLPPQDAFPTDTYLSDGGELSNEELSELYEDPEELLARLEDSGRIMGYFEDYFHQDGCDSSAGLREIFVESVLHETAAGAQQYLEWTKSRRVSTSLSVQDTKAVGDDGYTFQYDEESDCSPPDALHYAALNFRRYNALGFVAVGGVAETMTNAELEALVLQLARLMDERFVAEALPVD